MLYLDEAIATTCDAPLEAVQTLRATILEGKTSPKDIQLMAPGATLVVTPFFGVAGILIPGEQGTTIRVDATIDGWLEVPDMPKVRERITKAKEATATQLTKTGSAIATETMASISAVVPAARWMTAIRKAIRPVSHETPRVVRK